MMIYLLRKRLKMIKNDRLYRKHIDTMMVVGLGYCFMGAWTFGRMLLLCTMNFAYIRQVIYQVADEEFLEQPYAFQFMAGFVIILIMLTAVIDAGIRFFIGFSARADAMGKKRNAYIFWLFVVIFLDFITIFVSMSQLNGTITNELVDFIGAFLMNIMVLVISVDLLVSCLYVRRYRKLEAKGILKETPAKAETKDN